MRSFSFRTAILLFVSGIRNSDDHSAAYDSISVIQNGGLAGCDSPLLLIKFDVKTVLPRLLHHGRTSAVTVAYFHLRSDFSRETAAGDQIDIAHVQLFPEEKCLLPHAHDISLCILFTDEDGMTCGDPQTSSLTYRISGDPRWLPITFPEASTKQPG